MVKTFSSIVLRAILLLILGLTARADLPPVIDYQGRILVNSQPFDGIGYFRFALVDSTGTNTVWSNDGTSVGGLRPLTAIPLTVAKGVYEIMLGDTNVPGMGNPLTPAVFASPAVFLRCWFDDGIHGPQLVTPDQRIAATGYALVAASVPDGALSLSKLNSSAASSTTKANSLVLRDGHGNIAAATATLTGALKLPGSTSSQTGVLSIGGVPMVQRFGVGNTFLGNAGNFSTTGTNNTAVGEQALSNISTGTNNIAVGSFAGSNIALGNNNIVIGHPGVTNDNGIIRIGSPDIHSATYLAGTVYASSISTTNASISNPTFRGPITFAADTGLAGAVLVAGPDGQLRPSSVTIAELESLKGSRGNLQGQIDAKTSQQFLITPGPLVPNVYGSNTVTINVQGGAVSDSTGAAVSFRGTNGLTLFNDYTNSAGNLVPMTNYVGFLLCSNPTNRWCMALERQIHSGMLWVGQVVVSNSSLLSISNYPTPVSLPASYLGQLNETLYAGRESGNKIGVTLFGTSLDEYSWGTNNPSGAIGGTYANPDPTNGWYWQQAFLGSNSAAYSPRWYPNVNFKNYAIGGSTIYMGAMMVADVNSSHMGGPGTIFTPAGALQRDAYSNSRAAAGGGVVGKVYESGYLSPRPDMVVWSHGANAINADDGWMTERIFQKLRNDFNIPVLWNIQTYEMGNAPTGNIYPPYFLPQSPTPFTGVRQMLFASASRIDRISKWAGVGVCDTWAIVNRLGFAGLHNGDTNAGTYYNENYPGQTHINSQGTWLMAMAVESCLTELHQPKISAYPVADLPEQRSQFEGPGSGWTPNDFTYIGTYASNAGAQSLPTFSVAVDGSGAVTNVTVLSGGSGYNYCSPPLINITGGNGSGSYCLAQVSASTGSITNVLIQAAGSGYTSPTAAVFGNSLSFDPIRDPEIVHSRNGTNYPYADSPLNPGQSVFMDFGPTTCDVFATFTGLPAGATVSFNASINNGLTTIATPTYSGGYGRMWTYRIISQSDISALTKRGYPTSQMPGVISVRLSIKSITGASNVCFLGWTVSHFKQIPIPMSQWETNGVWGLEANSPADAGLPWLYTDAAGGSVTFTGTGDEDAIVAVTHTGSAAGVIASFVDGVSVSGPLDTFYFNAAGMASWWEMPSLTGNTFVSLRQPHSLTLRYTGSANGSAVTPGSTVGQGGTASHRLGVHAAYRVKFR